MYNSYCRDGICIVYPQQVNKDAKKKIYTEGNCQICLKLIIMKNLWIQKGNWNDELKWNWSCVYYEKYYSI